MLFYLQFFEYMKSFLTLDLGISMWTQAPVSEEIAARIEISVEIAILATLTSIFVALPLGILSAVRQNTMTDYVVRGISIAGIAMPSFWLGILIILGLLIGTQAWFGTPWMPPVDFKSIFDDPAYNLSQLIWPALATGYRYSAVATRMTRCLHRVESSPSAVNSSDFGRSEWRLSHRTTPKAVVPRTRTRPSLPPTSTHRFC